MRKRHTTHLIIGAITALVTLIAAVQLNATTPTGAWLPVVTLLLLLTIAVRTAKHTRVVKVAFATLHRFAFVFWLAWLMAWVAAIVGWLLIFQPAIGIAMAWPDVFYIVACGVVLVLLPTTHLNRDVRAQMGHQLSWRAGLLLTLATLAIIVIGLEVSFRHIAMSDNFAFSKMHENWHRLYWQPINELGYRDYAVAQANDGRQHIVVMGDSLVTGYGVNDIADTFPHRLGDLLGAEYSVNIVAQPGWGVSLALAVLQDYPLKPDILVVSHFINDIIESPAHDVYAQQFPSLRRNPDDSLRWWVDNVYLVNFLYWRVFHYLDYNAPQLYFDHIAGAYTNPDVWRVYEGELAKVMDWTQANDVQLVVLVWPNLGDVVGSRTMTAPVVDYFRQRDVPVVDMTDVLADIPAQQLVVSVFDAHPSIYAHEQAAQGLLSKVIRD